MRPCSERINRENKDLIALLYSLTITGVTCEMHVVLFWDHLFALY